MASRLQVIASLWKALAAAVLGHEKAGASSSPRHRRPAKPADELDPLLSGVTVTIICG